MSSPYTNDTQIYLLMSSREKRGRGFYERSGTYTFAFTTQAKARKFLKEARAVGLLTDIDVLYEMTVGEYFQWKAAGKTTADLNIDPAPDMLHHPFFFHGRFQDN